MKRNRYNVSDHAAQGGAALKKTFKSEDDYKRYMKLKALAGWRARKARAKKTT